MHRAFCICQPRMPSRGNTTWSLRQTSRDSRGQIGCPPYFSTCKPTHVPYHACTVPVTIGFPGPEGGVSRGRDKRGEDQQAGGPPLRTSSKGVQHQGAPFQLGCSSGLGLHCVCGAHMIYSDGSTERARTPRISRHNIRGSRIYVVA